MGIGKDYGLLSKNRKTSLSENRLAYRKVWRHFTCAWSLANRPSHDLLYKPKLVTELFLVLSLSKQIDETTQTIKE